MDFPQFPPVQYITQGPASSFADNPGERSLPHRAARKQLKNASFMCAPNPFTQFKMLKFLSWSILKHALFSLAGSGLNLKTLFDCHKRSWIICKESLVAISFPKPIVKQISSRKSFCFLNKLFDWVQFFPSQAQVNGRLNPVLLICLLPICWLCLLLGVYLKCDFLCLDFSFFEVWCFYSRRHLRSLLICIYLHFKKHLELLFSWRVFFIK